MNKDDRSYRNVVKNLLGIILRSLRIIFIFLGIILILLSEQKDIGDIIRGLLREFGITLIIIGAILIFFEKHLNKYIEINLEQINKNIEELQQGINKNIEEIEGINKNIEEIERINKNIEEILRNIPILNSITSINQLKKIECAVKEKVYLHVATMDFEFKNKFFYNVIKSNLKRGVDYTYFIPDNNRLDDRAKSLQDRLKDYTQEKSAGKITFKRVNSAETLYNLALYDVDTNKSEGYLILAFLESDPFCVKLDADSLGKNRRRLLEWDQNIQPVDRF